MRVWLAAFVLLFATIELFEWFMQLGSWQPTGMWLVLGGMGLAAISNASHLSVSGSSTESLTTDNSDAQQKATTSNQAVAQITETKIKKVNSALVDESDKDSISFKVRPLKR